MSYTAHHKNLAAYVGDPPRRNVAVNGVGILRRAFGALLNAMGEVASEADRTRNY